MACRHDTIISTHQQSGSLLIQMAVCLAITALIVMYTMQWAASAVVHYRSVHQHSHAQALLASATDVWARDMRAASGPIHRIQDGCAWQSAHGAVAWYVAHENLLRAQGSFINHAWQEESKGLMVEGVERIALEQQGGLVTLNIDMQSKQSPHRYTRIVCVRNGSAYA